jgi:hypothetical protein
MTNSDTPTDRDDTEGDTTVSRRPTGDGSEPRSDSSEDPVSGEPEDPTGTGAAANGRVVPRVVGGSDRPEEEPTDAAFPQEPEPIEPETPQTENAAFVLLGVVGTIGLLATVIVPGIF